MTAYATTIDVLRELGGTLATIQTRFDRRLWNAGEALSSVNVDGAVFDMPDSVTARIDVQLEYANSLVNSYVLQAYQATPTVVPAHLRSATAQLAAYRSVTTDGVRPDYLLQMEKEATRYMRALADGKMDLGTEVGRPLMRKPAAMFGSSTRRRSGGNGGGC